MSTYAAVLANINSTLTELEALVDALPDPIGDLTLIDTRITALAGKLQAKVNPPATPAP